MSAIDDLRTQIAWSCRILAMHGHADLTLGHVSGRGPDGIIYIKRKDLGLDEVAPVDVIGIDLDGNRVSGNGEAHLESVLHTEVYRMRGDVGAVIHTHPPYAVALGATRTPLELINHDAALFPDGLAVFDGNAALIVSSEMGRAVAEALGRRRAAIMRNHGVLVVGKTVPWATYGALTLERAVKIQTIAQSLGELNPLSREMAGPLYKEKYRDEFTDSYWRYLIRRVRRAGLAEGMETPGSG